MVITDDIGVALGRSPRDDSERAQWEMWIRDARSDISAGPSGSASIDLESLNQDRLDRVVREAVVAKIKRPDDATQVEIAVDDGRVSRTYQSGTGSIFIRPEWWRLLGLANDSQAFSVRPSFTPDTCGFPWVAR